jgi:ATP-dependent protease Clp ATPase subunit
MRSCVFCGKTERQSEYLFVKGDDVAICAECVDLAKTTLNLERAGRSNNMTDRVDITPYKIDFDLVRRLTREKLVGSRFIPLALYDDIKVIAVEDPAAMSMAVEHLKGALATQPQYKNKAVEVNVLLATLESFQSKLREIA